MPITLYRRHVKGCLVHALNLPPTAIRHFIDCDCPVWLTGHTDTEQYPRQSTGFTDWKAAESLRRSLIVKSMDTVVHGISIEAAIAAYLPSRDGELGFSTDRQYRRVLSTFLSYCSDRGVLFMQDISVDLLDRFQYDTFKGKASSRSVLMGKLRQFLRTAFRREWISKPLAEQISRIRHSYDQPIPFSDSEVSAILESCYAIPFPHGIWKKSPTAFRLIVELMLETGMRVSDASRFDPRNVIPSQSLCRYSFYPVKQRKTDRPKLVDSYIRPRMLEEINSCHWLSPSLPFSGDRITPYVMGRSVYKRMKYVGRQLMIADCRPHRLRDTFAVRKLLAGLSIEDVSRLLGHSSIRVTEQHYAAWTDSRRDRLERLLAKSLMNAEDNTLGDGKGDIPPLPGPPVIET